jgi:mono/diheme cytochrome c family protein
MGGIWASGGPSIDDQGYIYVSTGTSGRNGNRASVFEDSPGNWGQSILQLRDDPIRGFELTGTYTPFNYCIGAAWDVDLGSSGVVVVDLDPKRTSTSRLIALGGAKQGNVYLINRAPMPGSLTRRPPCSENPESDLSLMAPDIQPQYGKRGPINVFPPYAENTGYLDQARSRSTLAYFRDAVGGSYVFVTGAAKTGPDLQDSAPPSIAKLQIMTARSKPAFLRVTHLEKTQALQNASSPIVTSNGAHDAIVWVFDTNGKRSAPLYGPDAPLAVLYAFDATNLKLLWKSASGQLATTGKYNEPTVLNGVAYVGTDRIQAFGLRPQPGARFTTAPRLASPGAHNVASSQPPTTGRDLFAQRCAECHANAGSDAPQQAMLARLSLKDIVDALVQGPMRPQARGLTRQQIEAIAAYLTSGLAQ